LSRRISAPKPRTYPWSAIDSERRNSVLLIGGIAAIVVLAVALIGYGYYTERIAPKHASVVQVGDRDFDYAYVERRAKAEQIRGRLDVNDLGASLFALLQTIQREEVIRQAAKSLDIRLGELEIEAGYKAQLVVTDAVSREEFASRLRSELLRLGLTMDDYRDMTIATLLEQKLRAHFSEQVPAETLHLDLRLIQGATQADALKARDRLNAGESFGVVAVDLSSHASAQQSGGDLSWTPRGVVSKEVQEAAEALPIGGRSDIIETPEAFFIVQVHGKETRPVTDEGRRAIIQRQLDEQLRVTRDETNADITMTTNQLQELALKVSATRA
jgi:parvulin-like peptidyl-prolyl isomerase